LAIIIGVARRTGIDIAINNVWTWASKLVRNNVNDVAPAPKPNNIVKAVPAHVGQPTKSPVIAPNAPNFPPLFAIVNTVDDTAKFNPTKNDTETNRSKLMGITCNPTCSVKNAKIIGM
jgi:hypothetical protein